jgi:glyoxylase-like metal-dependent hydrolase (beta-lactamase superfamily II)
MDEKLYQDQLTVVTLVLGLNQTNVYLVGDTTSGKAVVIDPAWDGEVIVREADRRGLSITEIWLTHAHFDHLGGAAAVADSSETLISVALHPDDIPLWSASCGARGVGFRDFDPGPEPTIDLGHGMCLELESHKFEVRGTPGHTSGHVIFLSREAGLCFSGDLIFQGSVGRTDLPGGDWNTLITSIKEEILVLPDETQLLTGHGPTTTVGRERRTNPFLIGGFGF